MSRKISILFLIFSVLHLVGYGETVLYSDIGSIDGSFAVTPLGAASYSMDVVCPQSAGGFVPEIKIVYSSQSNYGLLGEHSTISGISAITTGARSEFYDGKMSALKHNATDAYYLDGKRLIHESGEWGQEGAVYQIEGEPKTKVRFHGQYTSSIAATWMEVTTPEGLKMIYGNSDNSRLCYVNDRNIRKINAWFLAYQENPLGYRIEYTYSQSDLMVYPTKIEYGMNSKFDTGLTHSIEFTYTDQPFFSQNITIEDQQGGKKTVN